MRPHRPAPLLMLCLPALFLISSISLAQTLQEPAQEADDSSIVPAANVADYCDVDGGRLYYQVFGEGPAIVLIHDGLLHSEVWDNQIGPLSARYKVIRYDRRGYG